MKKQYQAPQAHVIPMQGVLLAGSTSGENETNAREYNDFTEKENY